MNRSAFNKPSGLSGQLEKYYIFIGLVVPTTISIVLWITVAKKSVLPTSAYKVIIDHPASIQILVQLCSNILGIVHVSVVCKMINYATRVYFGTTPVSLDILRLWDALCSVRLDWTLPKRLIVPLLAFVAFAAVPSALWTGALTPTRTTVLRTEMMDVPHYRNMSLIRDMNPENYTLNSVVVRNNKGAFTYAIGLKMQGALLNSASSATTVDGGIRLHPKLDATGFTYINRSFGVGSSVGLSDDEITHNPHIRSYHFLETGLETKVACHHNRSSQYGLYVDDHNDSDTKRPKILFATGHLPNSNSKGEKKEWYFARNIGHDWRAGTVALGVTKNNESMERIIGIAAGKWYRHLNRTQCSMQFHPTLFNVSVGVWGRNISVSRVADDDNIDKNGKLSRLILRQFALISVDQTNIYNSLVGDSLNASISNFITQRINLSEPIPFETATLRGVENGFTAMADDILVAYGSAQSVVGHFTTRRNVTTELDAFRIGEDRWIFAAFATNVLILLLLAVEAVRTRCWRGLSEFDYIDPAHLVIGGVKGAPESTNVRNVHGKYVVSLGETGRAGLCLIVGPQPTNDQELQKLTGVETDGAQET